jgi:hypothetical protein
MPTHFWSKFLETNDTNESSTLMNKRHIGTPILIRQQYLQDTPRTAYPAPSNTFFSPI